MFFHTFLFVFLAEMADKTQLMMMALTNRYKLKTVVLGMISGVVMMSALSTLAGDVIGDVIPMKLIKIIASVMFLGFGFMNLRPEKENNGKSFAFKIPILSIAFTFMLAELGDKTQLATVALAADHMQEHPAIFLGASSGLILANMIAIFAGKFIFAHIHEDTIKVSSSFFFFLFGSVTLFEAISGNPLSYLIVSSLIMFIAYHIFTRSRK